MSPTHSIKETDPKTDPTADTELVPTLQSDSISAQGYRFWLVFLAIGLSVTITALELSAVSTALPRIATDLHASTFVWIGSAYALAATAFVPLAGGLAQIFGRRSIVLASLLIMSAGSAMAGATPSINFLIAARTLQGLGGGGISATTAIILSDLVPLHKRGAFNGIIGVFWSVSGAIGPVIGGVLAQEGQWRWLFYLNIPFAGVAMILFLFFLRVRTPPGTIWEKAARVDWGGNTLIVGSTTACCIALTWAGVEHAWNSAPVLIPLILGFAGLIMSIVYETFVPKYPLIPFSLMSTATGASGYLQTFLNQLIMLSISYYAPVYFQACKESSPIDSGLGLLAFALVIGPAGIIAGVSVNKTGRYRPQLWLAWVLLIVGLGSYTTLDADAPKANAIGLLVIAAAGMGILNTTTYFPVLAPIPVTSSGPALAYFMFLRNFAQVWGITIGGTVLQTMLSKHSFLASQLPSGAPIAYTFIPLIPGLAEPLKSEVRAAFAHSLRAVWFVNLGFASAGLLASAFMKHVPLHTTADKQWALQEAGPKPDGDSLSQRS